MENRDLIEGPVTAIANSSIPSHHTISHPFQPVFSAPNGSYFNHSTQNGTQQYSQFELAALNSDQNRQVETEVDVYGGRVHFRPKSEWSPVVESAPTTLVSLTAPANLESRTHEGARNHSSNPYAEQPLHVQSHGQTPHNIHSFQQPLHVQPFNCQSNGSGIYPTDNWPPTTTSTTTEQRLCRRHVDDARDERRPSSKGNASPVMVFTI